MSRSHRFATPAVMLATTLLLGTVACGPVDPNLVTQQIIPEHVKVLRMQVPALDDGPIGGIWMWRKSEVTGEFEPLSEIRFTDTVEENGTEFLEYELIDPSGNTLGVTLSAQIDRSGEVPELSLWFVRFSGNGEFKASLYNEAGESPLSTQTIVL